MDLQNGGGLRLVPVSLELLTEILQGKTLHAIPENVPADMKVIGSVTKNDLIVAGLGPYPPDAVMLLCQSKEWPVGEDIDRATQDIRIFEPTYRRA